MNVSKLGKCVPRNLSTEICKQCADYCTLLHSCQVQVLFLNCHYRIWVTDALSRCLSEASWWKACSAAKNGTASETDFSELIYTGNYLLRVIKWLSNNHMGKRPIFNKEKNESFFTLITYNFTMLEYQDISLKNSTKKKASFAIFSDMATFSDHTFRRLQSWLEWLRITSVEAVEKYFVSYLSPKNLKNIITNNGWLLYHWLSTTFY